MNKIHGNVTLLVINVCEVLGLKLLIYFFSIVAVLAIITFSYDLIKLGSLDWSSLAIIFCMIGGITTGLKINRKIQSKME